jgi:RNA polymerase sigma-70 factor (ECF subfamily)
LGPVAVETDEGDPLGTRFGGVPAKTAMSASANAGVVTPPADGAEVALVRAAQAGDRSAFGNLFRRYARTVHGILLARVRPSEADDLMQDVFLAALEKVASLREPSVFGGWLASIARNRATDHHRTRQPTEPLPDEIPHRDEGRSEAEQILTIIQTLPEAYRETLILRLVEGMSGPEIAAQVGLTPDSVRVNLHRGLKQLRARLSEEPKP